jgi:hypothetical protein
MTRARSRTPARTAARYEDEEGYGTGGEFDDPGQFQFHKIRVKVCVRDQADGVVVDLVLHSFTTRTIYGG